MSTRKASMASTQGSHPGLPYAALRAPEPRQGRYVPPGCRPGRADTRLSVWLFAVLVALAALGCRQDMHDQPKLQALEASDFFADGMASRRAPAGTVPWGQQRDDSHLWQGKDENGELVDALPAKDSNDEPMLLNRELVERGRDRYEIFCSVCHDSLGGGLGMIVRRGFKQPPPLYEERLKDMPAGYFFDVMTAGFGLMSSYAKQIPVEDRWAIVAYVRALQLSQTRTLAELSPELRDEFQQALTAPDEPAAEDHH